MKAAIINKANILSPSSLSRGYKLFARNFEEAITVPSVERFGKQIARNKANLAKMRKSTRDLCKKKGLDPDKLDQYTDLVSLGKRFYPEAIEYLRPLNVKQVLNPINFREYKRVALGGDQLGDLLAGVDDFAGGWLIFDAVIDPEIIVGSPDVKIKMSPTFNLSRDVLTVEISDIYKEPDEAMVGLHNTKGIYPEARISGRLYIYGLPKKLQDACRDYDPEFDKARDLEELRMILGKARIGNYKKTEIFFPILEEIGIIPHYIEEDGKEIKINSFHDALCFMMSSDKESPDRGISIPEIHGHYRWGHGGFENDKVTVRFQYRDALYSEITGGVMVIDSKAGDDYHRKNNLSHMLGTCLRHT
jgi:hypothetical protein